jgi:transposase
MMVDTPVMGKIDPDLLPDNVPACHQVIRDLVDRSDRMEQTLRVFTKALFGPKRDRLTREARAACRKMAEAHGWLSDEKSAAAEAEAQEAAMDSADGDKDDVKPPKKKGHGRRRLPAHLPRQVHLHDLKAEEKLCPGCGHEMLCIGVDESHQVDYVPAIWLVLEHRRPKYACPHCQDGIVVAAKLPAPIEKGLAGPNLLAHVIVSKYGDHLPLARQERIYARQGLHLARSTLCDWVRESALLLALLYECMLREVLASAVIHTDDTPQPFREKDAESTRKGRIWVYVGDHEHPYVVYDFSPDRKGETPRSRLQGFAGFLQADAYPGYEALYAAGTVIEVACWAHSRRKFVDAQSSDPVRAGEAVALIAELYRVEREALAAARIRHRQLHALPETTPDSRIRPDPQLLFEERAARRQTESVAILARINGWLAAQQVHVLPKSPMAEAIQYALNNWEALNRYVTDPRLDIDNNPAENALRPTVLGRVNHLFYGSEGGGRTAAILYSFIATCRRHDINPQTYLADVLQRIGSLPLSQLPELLPDRWKAAREKTGQPTPTPTPAQTAAPG